MNQVANTLTVAGGSALPISLGAELMIEFEGMNLKVKGELVGMDPGRCIILKFATKNCPVTPSALKECPIMIRYLHRGAIYSFRTSISSAVSSTAKLVFVNYPETVEEHTVRANPRYDCVLPSTAAIGDKEFDAVVIDISTGGCSCVVKDGNAEDLLRKATEKGEKATIRSKLPGQSDPLTLHGTIRNYSKKNTKASFGLMFGELDGDARRRVDEFISMLASVEK